LTVTGSTGIYLVKSGSSVALLGATDDAAVIEGKLQSLVPNGGPQIDVAPPIFRIAAGGDLRSLPALRVVEAGDLADASYSGSPHRITVNGSTGIYVISDGQGYALLHASASAAEIESALEWLPGIDGENVSVAPPVFHLAATGGLDAMLDSLEIVAPSALNTPPLTVSLTMHVGGTGDCFVLTDGTDSAVLPKDATAIQIETALETFDGFAAGVTVNGGVGGNFVISVTGGISSLRSLRAVVAADFAAASLTGTGASRELTVERATGLYVVKNVVNGSEAKYALLHASDKASEIGTALQTLLPSGWSGSSIDVDPGVFRIRAQGDLAALPLLHVADSAQGTIDITTGMASGGQSSAYVLTDGTAIVPVNATADAAAIKTAIETLPAFGNTIVSIDTAENKITLATAATAAGNVTLSFPGRAGGGTVTGITTLGSAVVGLPNTTGLVVGMVVTGTGIPARKPVSVTKNATGLFTIQVASGDLPALTVVRSAAATVQGKASDAAFTVVAPTTMAEAHLAGGVLTVVGETGSYVLKSVDNYVAIPATATAPAIQTAIQSLSGHGAAVVTTRHEIQPDGALASLPELKIVPAADLQKATLTAAGRLVVTGSTGAYVLTDGGSQALLRVDQKADQIQIQSALDIKAALEGFARIGEGHVSVAVPLAIKTNGTAADLSLATAADLANAVFDAPNDLVVTGAAGSSFVLTDGTDYALLPATATAGQIKTALEGFGSIGTGTVQVGNTYEISASDGASPTLKVAEAATATLALQQPQSSMRVLTVTGTTGYFVLTYNDVSVALPTTASAYAIRTALEGTAIGAHVSVAGSGGRFEISRSSPNGTWTLGNLSVATVATAKFDAANELTVSSSSGVYVVQSGSDVTVLKASDTAAQIETKLQALLNQQGGTPPTLDVAPSFFRIAPDPSLSPRPSLRVAGAADLAQASYSKSGGLAVGGSEGFYVITAAGGSRLLKATAPSELAELTATVSAITTALNGSGGLGLSSLSVAPIANQFQIFLQGSLATPQDLRVAGFGLSGAGDLPANLATFTNTSAPTAITIAGATGAYVVSDGIDFALLRATDGAATIEAALGTLGKIGAWNVSVAPPEYVITGASTPQTLAIATAGDFATATLGPSGLSVTGSGVYVMSDGAGFVAIPANANAAAIQAKLEQLPSVGVLGVGVTGTVSPFIVTRQSASDSTLTVSGRSGAYVLTDDTHMAALAYDATAADIQAALGAFTTTGTPVAVDKKASPLQYDLGAQRL
jgi:hypothetical protein